MIIALVEYISKNGKIAMKSFQDENLLSQFIAKLESKKTEYIVTRL